MFLEGDVLEVVSTQRPPGADPPAGRTAPKAPPIEHYFPTEE
jgi:hypothetical protein